MRNMTIGVLFQAALALVAPAGARDLPPDGGRTTPGTGDTVTVPPIPGVSREGLATVGVVPAPPTTAELEKLALARAAIAVAQAMGTRELPPLPPTPADGAAKPAQRPGSTPPLAPFDPGAVWTAPGAEQVRSEPAAGPPEKSPAAGIDEAPEEARP